MAMENPLQLNLLEVTFGTRCSKLILMRLKIRPQYFCHKKKGKNTKYTNQLKQVVKNSCLVCQHLFTPIENQFFDKQKQSR